jgi:hypothetical protein
MKARVYPGKTANEQSHESGSIIEAPRSKGKASFDGAAGVERLGSHSAREWLNTIKHPKKRLFLEIYANSGRASIACRAVGIGRSTEWLWRKRDSQFAALREQAHAMAVESMEDEARRRAVDGTVEPVFAGGKVCGSIRRYSDSLLIFLLKAAKPEVYRDRWRGSVHVIAEPSAFRGLDLARLSEAQLEQLEEIAAAATRETDTEDAELGRLIDFADDMAGP